MKQYILLPKIDFDLKFQAKECGDNINTEIKKTLNRPHEGSDFKLAIFNRLKNIEKALNQPKSSIVNPVPSPPKSKIPSIASSSTTMKESDTESVASNAYDSAIDDLVNEKTSTNLLGKLKSETPLDDLKIEGEKLILPSPENNLVKPKPPLKLNRKQKHNDRESSLIERLTGSGKIDLLPDGRLFNNVTGTSIPLHEFYHILTHWNKKISEAQITFLKPIIGLLHLSEVKNKTVKNMIEEESFKNPRKRWLTTSPY